MRITKVLIHRNDNCIITLAYDNDKLITMLTDSLTSTTTESVFIGKLTRVSQATNSGFIQYTHELSGFINLNKTTPTQSGTYLLAQLTWLGDTSKQAKLRNNFELVGKYLVYHKSNDTLQLKAKHLDASVVAQLEQHLQKYPASWIVRSNVRDAKLIDAITLEAKELHITAEKIIQARDKSSTIKTIYSGTPNYLKVLRELPIVEDCEIISNDETINNEILAKQDCWLIDAITLDKALDITQELVSYQNITQENIITTKNDTNIEYGSVAGIHIFDINSNHSKQSHANTNLDAIDTIYQQIILRNLQGIILLDIIKNTSKNDEQKIISRLEKLFKQDISRTQVLGISNSGLIELIRNKY